MLRVEVAAPIDDHVDGEVGVVDAIDTFEVALVVALDIMLGGDVHIALRRERPRVVVREVCRRPPRGWVGVGLEALRRLDDGPFQLAQGEERHVLLKAQDAPVVGAVALRAVLWVLAAVIVQGRLSAHEQQSVHQIEKNHQRMWDDRPPQHCKGCSEPVCARHQARSVSKSVK